MATGARSAARLTPQSILWIRTLRTDGVGGSPTRPVGEVE